MAKKASTKRVHQIAKELGVTSKDIVLHVCGVIGTAGGTGHVRRFTLFQPG